MWNLKHDISSQKFHELLNKTELKGDTDLDLKNFFNYIKMCLNELTRLIEDPQGRSWRSTYQTSNNLDYLHLKFFKINPHIDKNIVVPTVCGLSKYTLSQLINQRFGHVSIIRLKRMARKGLIEGLPDNLPELEEPCPICILTKETKIPRGPTTDISKFAPGFMLQIDFSFLNVETIRRFTSIFVII